MGEGWRTSFMSMPMARPEGPTLVAARKTSKPAPLPRSMTVSPCWEVSIGNMWLTGLTGLLQTGDGQRVAAAQAEVGILGDVGELVGAVAEGFGHGLAVLGAGAPRCRAVVLADLIVDLGWVHVEQCVQLWCEGGLWSWERGLALKVQFCGWMSRVVEDKDLGLLFSEFWADIYVVFSKLRQAMIASIDCWTWSVIGHLPNRASR